MGVSVGVLTPAPLLPFVCCSIALAYHRSFGTGLPPSFISHISRTSLPHSSVPLIPRIPSVSGLNPAEDMQNSLGGGFPPPREELDLRAVPASAQTLTGFDSIWSMLWSALNAEVTIITFCILALYYSGSNGIDEKHARTE